MGNKSVASAVSAEVEVEVAELSCPICLISSHDETTTTTTNTTTADEATSENVTFLKTPCQHIFCQPCIERVLLKPRHQDSIPTRAPCPMCRESVNLFDLCHAIDSSSSSVYAGNSNVNSWPIATSQYKQRSLIPMPNADAVLQSIIDEKGAIKGFGIK